MEQGFEKEGIEMEKKKVNKTVVLGLVGVVVISLIIIGILGFFAVSEILNSGTNETGIDNTGLSDPDKPAVGRVSSNVGDLDNKEESKTQTNQTPTIDNSGGSSPGGGSGSNGRVDTNEDVVVEPFCGDWNCGDGEDEVNCSQDCEVGNKDSLLHLGQTGYVVSTGSDFVDLDYSKDFSVEIIVNIPANYGETLYDPIISKSATDTNHVVYPGWALVIGHGEFNDYGKPIQVVVKDGTEGINFRSGGIAGNNYLTLTWDVVTKEAILYVNGDVENSETNSNITSQNIKDVSSDFLIGKLSRSTRTFKRDVMMARLWNRKLSSVEISNTWNNYESNNQHVLPAGFDTTELLSEWLMQESSDVNGTMGITYVKDSVGDNHLELMDGAELSRANGLIDLVYPLDGSTGVDKNPVLRVNGGIGELNGLITKPLQYYFEIDEVSTFDSPALQTSGKYVDYNFVSDWVAYYGKWEPTLKPDTIFYWRVKVRDSSATPIESGWSDVSLFTTEGSQDWYVRPHLPGTNYGIGDGANYDDAWNGLFDVKWKEQGVGAGDTLYICGGQLRQLSNRNYVIPSSYNYMTASGYSDEYPVTITTDCPGDPGKIWGYTNRSGSFIIDWDGPDENNIYSTTDLSVSYMGLLAQDINGLNAILLDRAAGPDLDGLFGAYYYEGGVTYVRLTDGGNPTYRVFDQYGPFIIYTNGQSYIKYENYNSQGLGITLLGKSRGAHIGSQLVGVTYPRRPVSTHMTFEDINISYMKGTGFGLRDGNDYTIIRNSHFSNVGNGIYLSTYKEHGADFVLIENNTFRDIGVFSSGGDAHAIGIQSGNNWIIQNNHIENVGSAIEYFAWSEVPSSNFTIRYNFIKNATAHTTSGSGIVLSGSSSNIAVGTRLENYIYNNIVLNAEDYCYSTNHRDVNYWYNNICYNSSVGFRLDSPWAGAGPNSVIYNNIIVNSDSRFIFANGPADGDWDITSDYNLFYKESGTADFVVQGKSISTSDLAEFQSYGYDNHSIIADPLFVSSDPQEVADFKLQEGSPAIDKGLDLSAIFDSDFEGNKRNGNWDIGAYESSGGACIPDCGANVCGMDPVCGTLDCGTCGNDFCAGLDFTDIFCSSGSCGSQITNCDDGDDCTTDSCADVTGCSNTIVSCSEYDGTDQTSCETNSCGLSCVWNSPNCELSASLTTSLTQFGITWTFQDPVQYGTFVNGDYWVVDPDGGDVNIIDIFPASIIGDGATLQEGEGWIVQNGRTVNGAMRNTLPGPNHGFDSDMLTGAMAQYNSILNVARPSEQDISVLNPLELNAGSSLVSTISLEVGDSYGIYTRSAAILTILNSPIQNNYYFRPTYIGDDKTIQFNKNQLNYSILKNLTHPSSNMLTLHKDVLDDSSDQDETVERMFERPWIDFMPQTGGRASHPIENMGRAGVDVNEQFGEGILMLNLDFTNLEKENLFISAVQKGIDYYGIIQNGSIHLWINNGGHGPGRKFPILFAGFALDNQEMISIALVSGDYRDINGEPANHPNDYVHFGEDDQTFYINQTDVDRWINDPNWPNCASIFRQQSCSWWDSFEQDDLGKPEWGYSHATSPENRDSEHWDSEYLGLNLATFPQLTLALNIMGQKPAWNHPSLFDFTDRWWDMTCVQGSCGDSPPPRFPSTSSFGKSMWNTYRDQVGCKYVGLNTVSHTRQYDCDGDDVVDFDCGSVTLCDDYNGNTRAEEYDPCDVGGCESEGSGALQGMSASLKPTFLSRIFNWFKSIFVMSGQVTGNFVLTDKQLKSQQIKLNQTRM